MANYTGTPRYARPLINERPPGPRFNTPPNRNIPHHNLNDQRPQINITQQQSHSINPTKPINDTTISTPPTSNSPAIRNQTVTNATSNSIDLTTDSSNKSSKISSTENKSAEETSYNSLETSNTAVDNKLIAKIDTKISDKEQQSIGQKRPRTETNSQQQNVFDSTTSLSQQQINERKTTQGGRCRLFIGNVPSDLTQDEFQLLFGKYGELVEYFVNPSRGFGFIKLSSRQLAEQAKYDLDGYVLRGKPLRIRFASQGATIKVKNLSLNVSNELLKEAFEQYFGGIERAVVIVDDRGKSTGEGIIEFEKKPSAQKCLNECTERCFFITKPVIVEPWDIKDEEDGLPEKSLTRNSAYIKEREAKPRFAELNTVEHTIGLKWKELELQEKQLLEEVKRRMQYASEQVKIEIDQMYLEHQSQVLREELLRRQEELRRIDELRSQEIDRRRNIIPMHHTDAYHNPFNISTASISNVFHQNQAAASALQYNDFQQIPYSNSSPLIQQASPIAANIDAAYTTNQVARGYGLANARSTGDDYIQQQQGFDRKRPRY
ncbi:unnamed protein product [Rotaria sp. Silwood2]|nr:unnamed protein product [Rotaria sp. Silwood2]CAF3916976.1 unnamed protein product [Rotaria sp. Silwood2]